MGLASNRIQWRNLSPFQIAKYVVFALVLFDVGYYLVLDVDAAQFLGADARFIDILQTYGGTIDYLAWVVLLVLYELETDYITAEKLRGRLGWAFTGVAAVCYAVLVFACWTYVVDLTFYDDFRAVPSDSVCSSADSRANFLDERGEYAWLTAENCGALVQGEVLLHADQPTYVTAAAFGSGKRLGQIAVLNAVVWIALVILFQIEFMLQRRIGSPNRWSIAIRVAKTALYLLLVADAVYWARYGSFIDAWDASLWLFAFLAIDLNGFNLSEEPIAMPAQTS